VHSWDTYSCSAAQDTPHFLWNLTVNYHVHKTVPEASSPRLHILLIHFNIILPSTPRSCNWSLVFMSSEENVWLICDCLHAFFMTHLAPSLRFNEVNNIQGLGTGAASPHKQLPLLWSNTSPLSSEVQGPWRFSSQWNIHIVELCIMQFSWACVYFLPHRSSSQYTVLRHPRVLGWCVAVLLGYGRIAVGLLDPVC